jgi:hypothetical protein
MLAWDLWQKCCSQLYAAYIECSVWCGACVQPPFTVVIRDVILCKESHMSPRGAKSAASAALSTKRATCSHELHLASQFSVRFGEEGAACSPQDLAAPAALAALPSRRRVRIVRWHLVCEYDLLQAVYERNLCVCIPPFGRRQAPATARAILAKELADVGSPYTIYNSTRSQVITRANKTMEYT